MGSMDRTIVNCRPHFEMIIRQDHRIEQDDDLSKTHRSWIIRRENGMDEHGRIWKKISVVGRMVLLADNGFLGTCFDHLVDRAM